jgi:hypothetical protein
MAAPKRRMYTPEELSVHNTAKDCWVSIFYRVFDLSAVIAKNRGPLTQPIIDVRLSRALHQYYTTDTGATPA